MRAKTNFTESLTIVQSKVKGSKGNIHKLQIQQHNPQGRCPHVQNYCAVAVQSAQVNC